MASNQTKENITEFNREDLLSKLEKAQFLLNEKKIEEALKLLDEIIATEKIKGDISVIYGEAKNLARSIRQKRNLRTIQLLMLLVFSLVTVLILFLGLSKVNSTEVELSLKLSEVSTRLIKTKTLNSLNLKSIRLFNFENIIIDCFKLESPRNREIESDTPTDWKTLDILSPIQVDKTSNNWNFHITSDYLNLTYITIDSGAILTIEKDFTSERSFSLRIQNGSVNGLLNTHDTYLFDCQNCKFNNSYRPNDIMQVTPFDNQVRFRSSNKVVEMRFEILPSDINEISWNFATNIFSDSLYFAKVQTEKGEDITEIEESAILEDAVGYFTELNGKKFTIRQGDILEIDVKDDFQIRRIDFTNGIDIKLFGKVTQLKSGTSSTKYSKLPTRLEWLHTNQFLTLSIATLIPVFSLLIALMYRLRITKV